MRRHGKGGRRLLYRKVGDGIDTFFFYGTLLATIPVTLFGSVLSQRFGLSGAIASQHLAFARPFRSHVFGTLRTIFVISVFVTIFLNGTSFSESIATFGFTFRRSIWGTSLFCGIVGLWHSINFDEKSSRIKKLRSVLILF
jgi:hypothetical protein